ncbi:MAG: ABC transporter permease, partial [Tepidisphaeraceae bacterium]
LGIPTYLWRLLPGNPILIRVVSMAGQRMRDLLTRCIYLALLIGVVLLAIFTSSGVTGSSLDQLASASERIFMQMSYLQLFVVSLLAPIFTAGAITQERDAQTYDILLSTPLTNGQIILGSLGSRLFFIVALLISGIPIFSITQIFGGVGIGDIALSFTIAAATAIVTGALATAIATFKIGTRRTIFSFYMLIITFLVGGYLLDQASWMHPTLIDPLTQQPTAERAATGWLSGIHPFLALQTLFSGNRPPDVTTLPPVLRHWPMEWYLTRPATFFPTFMLTLSAVLVLPSIVVLRRVAQSSFSLRQTLARWVPLRIIRGTRAPRTVWMNPIAWREARTKSSAARASITRYGFILLGLIGAGVVLVLYVTESKPPTAYIQAGSYDPGAGSLHVLGENQTYGITPATRVTVDGSPESQDRLFGRYEVLNHQTVTQHGTKILTELDLGSIGGRISRTQAHQFLLGGVLVELVVILLVVTNAAASTVTREREDGTLDILLSTPISSRTYLCGKLVGLRGFVLPLVIVPALSVAMFVIADAVKWILSGDTSGQWLVWPEAILLLPLVMMILAAFATVVGMQMSLRNRTTVRAVMSSLGIVIGCMSLLGWCGYTANGNAIGALSVAITAFSPLGVVATMIYPDVFGGTALRSGSGALSVGEARLLLAGFTLVAIALYSGAIWTLYQSMVKNFDMTIRRQSR